MSLFFAIPTWSGNCTFIEIAPYTIERPGCYKVQKDLVLSSLAANGILIKSNHVQLDLNKHIILGPLSANGSGAGVYANAVDDVVIMNGTVRGFLYGIRIDGGSLGDDSRNTVITNISVEDNFFRGIAIEAENAVISDNKILNTGRTTLFPDAFAVALEVKGKSCKITHNIIDGVFLIGVGEGIGISLSNNRAGCAVANNRINTPAESYATFGIWLSSESVATSVNANRIKGFIFPFSIPRKKEDQLELIAVDFKNNIMNNVACTPNNFKSYFIGLPASNHFKKSRDKCPVLVQALSEYAKEHNDARTIFRLAMAKYQCVDEPKPDYINCCKMQRESVQLFKVAAELGLEEAARILPRVESVVSKICPD